MHGQAIYTKRPDRPMRVCLFGSGSGTILKAVLDAKSPLYEVVVVVADKPCGFLTVAENKNIPTLLNPFKEFFAKRGVRDIHDVKTRIAYDEKHLKLLQTLNTDIDLIFLAGYMRIVYAPLLNAFPNQIVNVHPADLTVKNESGMRKYIGGQSVKDALEAGETKTRSTVFLVDEHLDTGPILVSGPFVTYTEGRPITKEKALIHQEKQKRESDIPATLTALDLIAKGSLRMGNDRSVYLNEKKLGGSGVECAASLG